MLIQVSKVFSTSWKDTKRAMRFIFLSSLVFEAKKLIIPIKIVSFDYSLLVETVQQRYEILNV